MSVYVDAAADDEEEEEKENNADHEDDYDDVDDEEEEATTTKDWNLKQKLLSLLLLWSVYLSLLFYCCFD